MGAGNTNAPADHLHGQRRRCEAGRGTDSGAYLLPRASDFDVMLVTLGRKSMDDHITCQGETGAIQSVIIVAGAGDASDILSSSLEKAQLLENASRPVVSPKGLPPLNLDLRESPG